MTWRAPQGLPDNSQNHWKINVLSQCWKWQEPNKATGTIYLTAYHICRNPHMSASSKWTVSCQGQRNRLKKHNPNTYPTIITLQVMSNDTDQYTMFASIIICQRPIPLPFENQVLKMTCKDVLLRSMREKKTNISSWHPICQQVWQEGAILQSYVEVGSCDSCVGLHIPFIPLPWGPAGGDWCQQT